MHAQGEVT